MKALNISEIRSTLPQILAKLRESHETVTILRYGRPVAKIIPIEDIEGERYPLRGLPISMDEDFNEPLPELWDVLDQ